MLQRSTEQLNTSCWRDTDLTYKILGIDDRNGGVSDTNRTTIVLTAKEVATADGATGYFTSPWSTKH
jgi:hypothetical protein